ncbi:MAG TPA: hypothetical protein VMT46_19670 [Anaerolineaceae bacterium]|nr:hypothetical protein [Anaerolineaceae bacterium]
MPHRLETKRLILRQFIKEDIVAAYPVLEGHPDVWKFDPGYQRSTEEREALIQKYILTNSDDGCGMMAV